MVRPYTLIFIFAEQIVKVGFPVGSDGAGGLHPEGSEGGFASTGGDCPVAGGVFLGGSHPAADVPPPLPPPPAAFDPAVPLGRRARGSNLQWPFAGGHLTFDEPRHSLNAHCHDPRHYSKSNPCRVNRTIVEGLCAHQGRPLGILCRWLEADCATSELHTNMLKPQKTVSSGC